MSGERVVRKMIVSKVSDEAVAEGEEPKVVDTLELDFEIPVEHEELLESMAKLFSNTDKRHLTMDELREFESVMERKGVVEKGGLLKRGGILDKAGFLTKDGELVKEDPGASRQMSLAEEILPAIEKAQREKKERELARRRTLDFLGRYEKEGTISTSSSSSSKRVSSSVNRQRIVKEIRAKQLKAARESGNESKSSVTKENKSSSAAKGDKTSITKESKSSAIKEDETKESKINAPKESKTGVAKDDKSNGNKGSKAKEDATKEVKSSDAKEKNAKQASSRDRDEPQNLEDKKKSGANEVKKSASTQESNSHKLEENGGSMKVREMDSDKSSKASEMKDKAASKAAASDSTGSQKKNHLETVKEKSSSEVSGQKGKSASKEVTSGTIGSGRKLPKSTEEKILAFLKEVQNDPTLLEDETKKPGAAAIGLPTKKTRIPVSDEELLELLKEFQDPDRKEAYQEGATKAGMNANAIYAQSLKIKGDENRSVIAETLPEISDENPNERERCTDDDKNTTFRSLLYSSERVTARPGPDGKGPPVIVYQLALKSLSCGTNKVESLELWEVPKTGLNIKDRIQRQFQIPHSFQHDLNFNGKNIEDSTNLVSIGLKAGDKMELTYLSDGQLEEVRVGVKWFEFLLRFGKDRHPSIFTGMPMEYNVVCVQGLNECWAEMLANDLFLPWDSDTKYANRVYFMDQNGLESLLDVYELLIREQWRTMVLRLKLIESGCILVLASLGSSTLNRQKIIAADGHGFVLQSFLRVLMRRGCPLVDNSGSPGLAKNNDFLIKDVIDAALKFFINFRECQEIHIDICSRSSAIDQVLAISHSPSFNVQQAQGAMCLLVCCMHCPDTHKWLCRNPTFEAIADTVRTHRERGVSDSKELTLLHYYAQVTLSHLVLSSVNFMSKRVLDKLVLFMEDFLKNTTPNAIQELERARYPHSGWSPFFPYLKALLSPMKSKPDQRSRASEYITVCKLQDLSLETMLFVIQVMAGSNPYKARRQLLEEKLLSYALCLSANIHRRLLPSARIAVNSLRSNSTKPVPIPKLSIMARAKLASIHFGLKKVMDRSAEELKLEVSPPPPRSTRSALTKDGFNPLFCIISM